MMESTSSLNDGKKQEQQKTTLLAIARTAIKLDNLRGPNPSGCRIYNKIATRKALKDARSTSELTVSSILINRFALDKGKGNSLDSQGSTSPAFIRVISLNVSSQKSSSRTFSLSALLTAGIVLVVMAFPIVVAVVVAHVGYGES